MPALTEFLEDLFFWPGSARKLSTTVNFWHFNTTLGNKHAILTLVGIFIVICAGLFIKTQPLNWSSSTDTPFSSQAKTGANVVSSHYPTGSFHQSPFR